MKARRGHSKLGLLGAALVAACALLPALAASGCGGFDPDAVREVKTPLFDPDGFRLVSAVFERRCGTLDCHGAIARPLRIYGQYGLRRPEPENSPNVENYAEYYPGGKESTTLAELNDNYSSICGLEPELVGEVFAKTAQPEVLSIIRKARLIEKHKGGRLWNKGDPGDVCLTNWFTGSTDTTPCEIELGHP